VKILERASKLRQTALDYFRSIGMFDGEPFGIFDLGWYLTCQTALRRIIRSAGNDCFVGGLYLGLHIERQPPVIAGYSEAVCHTPAPDMLGSYKPFHLDSHLATLLEAFLGLAEHPTTAGYDESGPVFERESRSPESMAMIQEIHRMIENYCTHMVPDLIFPENDERDCKFAITSLVAAFFDNPCKEILNISASISMSSALEGEPARPLVRPLGWADLCEALRGREDLRRQSFWPAADKMVSSPMMRLAIGAVRTLWGRTRNALSS
jgi:hypothetical protein